MASALLSYGADIKIKNILMEMFFSALPPVMMSDYELFDQRDELVVDLLFQYVKSTLKERNNYETVAQGLMLETYPDLRLDELSPDEISLLADFAIKRVVWSSIEKINNKIYANPISAVKSFDSSIEKFRFIESLTRSNDSSVSRMIRLENTGKLSILEKDGTFRKFPSVVNHSYYGEGDAPYCRIPSGAYKVPTTGKSSYMNPVYCFEPYIRIEAKDLEDIVLCTKEILWAYDGKEVSDFIALIANIFTMLGTGDYYWSSPTTDPLSEAGYDNIKEFAGKQIVCSVDDLESLWKDRLNPALLAMKVSGSPLLNALLKGVSLGVRCSVDTVSKDQYFNDPPQEDWETAQTVRLRGLGDKTFYYLEPFDNANGSSSQIYTHFTSVLAEKEQKYAPEKMYTVITQGKKFNDLNASEVFGWSNYSASNASLTGNPQGLLIELLRSKEFDALIKSVFVPAMLYNTISLIPNIEIGQDLIPLMRQRGVFKGLDEVLDGMFSLVMSYLLGDFSWNDCGDLAKEL
jgi:hypothetical protein